MKDKNEWLAHLLKGSSKNSQYENIVSGRTGFDDMGDALLEQSRQPALNGKQKWGNALMSGFGAGLKASQSDIRNAKLQELEKQSKQVAMTNAKMQTQLGEAALIKASYANWGAQNKATLLALDKMVANGDEEGLKMNVPRAVNDFINQYPDIGKNMGTVDHYDNGRVYLEKDGKIEGVFLRDLTASITENLQLEDQEKLKNLGSIITKQKFDRFDQQQDLDMQDKRSHIANQNASANYHNAQADKLNSQANARPPKYPDKVLHKIMETNTNWINESKTKIKDLEKISRTYELIHKVIKEESEGLTGRAGNGLISIAQRFMNKSGTESSKNQALLDLYRHPLMKELKEIHGARPTNEDLHQFLLGIPSLDKDPEASMQIAKQRAEQYKNEAKEISIRRKVLERDFQYGEPYNSDIIDQSVEKELSGNDIGAK